jgi:hypothetical protein
MTRHNQSDPNGVPLQRPKFLDSGATVLKMNDFDFMISWVDWCRQTAQKLTKREKIHWRARDVEMAVFWARGDRDAKRHPVIDLPPLPSLCAEENRARREPSKMAVYKRGKIWWYRNGESIRESTKQSNKRIAEQMEATHKASLAKEKSDSRRRESEPRGHRKKGIHRWERQDSAR